MHSDIAHILVVDDDTRLRELLCRFLREENFMVSAAKDAAEARDFLLLYNFDLLIVDVMMPNETGFEFLQKLRQTNQVPVIMLTAVTDSDSRIQGLEHGADDYIGKPFEPKELVLRINNILKHTKKEMSSSDNILYFGSLSFDTQSKQLTNKSKNIIHLSPLEENILSIMSAKCGQIFQREELAGLLGAEQNARSIDVQITRLRKKLEPDTKNPKFLKTVRGKGYVLIPDKI